MLHLQPALQHVSSHRRVLIDSIFIVVQSLGHCYTYNELEGRSQDFSKGGGGGGHTGSNNIVMAFSPRNIVGCLLKSRVTKGGSRAPQDPPSATPLDYYMLHDLLSIVWIGKSDVCFVSIGSA